ncbi:hypothetical protein GCM10029992_12180 [Glycomyces albus]
MMGQAPAGDRLLTPAQVQEKYGYSPQALANMRWRREGPAYIKGKGRCGRVKYRQSDIEAWLDSNRVDPEAVA